VSRLIGVTPLYDRFSQACQTLNPRQFPAGVSSSLKRDALLFDSLAVTDWMFVGGNEFVWSLPRKGTIIPNEQHIIGNHVYVPEEMWGRGFISACTVMPEVAAEVNWLFEQGILHHSTHFELHDDIPNSEVSRLHQIVRENLRSAPDHNDEYFWAGRSKAILPLNRFVCLKLEATESCTAVPIYDEGNDADVLAGSCLNIGIADVAQVVIQAMPHPDEMTPWEAIIEFRQDPDASAKALGLRRWMRKIANESRPVGEIREELEWLLTEYERYMRLHRMKVNVGIVETVVTTTAELIEDITKLKFSHAASLPFVAKHRRIALLEAELQAPGREVAYISKAHAALGQR
jgi:hypothetical protein